MSSEEIVLESLPDDELVKQMHDDLYDGLADEIVRGTEILLARGWSAEKTLSEALVEGMGSSASTSATASSSSPRCCSPPTP